MTWEFASGARDYLASFSPSTGARATAAVVMLLGGRAGLPRRQGRSAAARQLQQDVRLAIRRRVDRHAGPCTSTIKPIFALCRPLGGRAAQRGELSDDVGITKSLRAIVSFSSARRRVRMAGATSRISKV